MLYNVHTAKSQLWKLLDAAVAGEEVVIAKGTKPVVRLVAIPQSGFWFGVLAGKAGTPPDFFEPMPEAELSEWEGREGPA